MNAAITIKRLRSVRIRATNGFRLFPLALLAIVSCPAAGDLPVSYSFGGYGDIGFVQTDTAPSWFDEGPGKGRYGGDRRGNKEFKVIVPEISLLGDMMVGAATTFHLQLKYDDEQRHPVDIAEAYVMYRSPPHPQVRWRVKLGTFLPPMSLENHAIGWTSPYTLTSSALNAWIGEELRINGPELRLRFTHGQYDIDVAGAAYIGNDPAGTLISYRGWSIHDRELALFDDSPIPKFQIDIINPRGPFRMQADTFEPLHEIDGRVGFYAGIEIKNEALGRLLLYGYDNNADPTAINRTAGQYAWHTRFVTLGYRGQVAEGLTLVVQTMYGDSVMGRRLGSERRHASDVDYYTVYALLSQAYDKWRFTTRAEYFGTNDRDPMRFNYDNDEDGYAVTGTVMHSPIEQLKLALEIQYINHERPIRRLTGSPHRFDELTARANLRWFF